MRVGKGDLEEDEVERKKEDHSKDRHILRKSRSVPCGSDRESKERKICGR